MYTIRRRHRRSIRLSNWDYRQRGAYFVTICTHERALLFKDGQWCETIEDVWRTVTSVGDDPPDEFVVMPNHVHGIIWLPGTSPVGAQQPDVSLAARDSESNHRWLAGDAVAAPLRRPDAVRRVEPGSLAAIVRSFKAATAKRINNLRRIRGAAVWQRNYYERVIRDESELNAVREYILDNPRKWAEDKYNPANVRSG